MIWEVIAFVRGVIERMNLADLLQDLLVASFTLLVGAWFVLRRIRNERAFDRSLAWRESTLRATNKFIRLSERLVTEALDTSLNRILASVDPVQKIATELRDCASELRKALLDEAVLFADRKTVNQLRSAAEDIESISKELEKVAEGSEGEEEYVLVNKLPHLAMKEIQLSLVHSLRKQLGLEQLTESDLGLSPERERNEPTGGRVSSE
jgi:hypothetical protein